MLLYSCDTSEYYSHYRCIFHLVKMHPLFLHLYGVKDVSQHLRLCIFQCVASSEATHFFIFRRIMNG